MAIEFVCPACRGGLRVADTAAGGVVRCGNCMATLRVPVPPDGDPAADAFDSPKSRADAPAAAVDGPSEPVRRRRRRRPPPPPPPSSGLLKWVLGGLFVLGLVCAGTCAGLVAVFQEKWRQYDSAAGGFRVELPADPQPDMGDLARVRPQPAVRVEGAILIGKVEEYAVIYADIDPAVRQVTADRAILDKAVAGIAQDVPGGKVTRNEPTRVDGFEAREVVFVHPDAGTFVGRVVVADTRLFVVTAGGALVTDKGNPRTKRFLDSFKVTDPKLAAARGKGRAGGKKAADPPPE